MTYVSALNFVHKIGKFGDYKEKSESNLLKVSEVNKLLIFQVAKYRNSNFDISKIKIEFSTSLGRELEYYTKSLEENGFTIKDIQCHPINASVDEWYDFLSVYHEGVLGWVGGAEKVYNQKVSSHFISLRKALMRLAMEDIFNGSDSFQAAWTYINAS